MPSSAGKRIHIIADYIHRATAARVKPTLAYVTSYPYFSVS